jgi:adenosine deaminase
MTFRQLPKIELHLHLDCSLSHAVASRLDPGLTREAFARDFIAPAKCRDLADYLTRAPSGIRLLQSREALRLAVEDLFAQLQEDGVIYAEIRFAPLLHTEQGLNPAAVVEAVDRAMEEAIRATGVEARLILCTLRHYAEAQSLETAQLVEAFRGSRVAALDLAADEAGFPIAAHIPAFRFAQERGLARTAHAGEARGAESVRETLAELQPSRLGHGVRSIEDPGLLDSLVANRIHLEVCPSCNVQTGVCEAYAEHPVHRLFQAGVSMGINTDTRTITNITLSKEYQRLEETFGWGLAHFRRCNLDALAAAFLDQPTQARLREKILISYGEPA